MIENIAIVSLSNGTIGDACVRHEVNIGIKRLNELGTTVRFMPHALKGEGIYAYVVTRDEVPWSDDVRKKLRDTVRRDIGALASPEYIQFVEAMPKTCSGKVIRRMLRKIAGNVYDDLGDTTALAKPEVLDHIIVGHRNLLQGQHETANLPDEDQPKE